MNHYSLINSSIFSPKFCSQPPCEGKMGISRRLTIALVFLAVAASATAEDTFYKQPAKPVLEALKALPTPAISVSPRRDYAILAQAVRYPSINEVAQPMLRLAGIRIDSNTNGMHLAANYLSFTIRRLSDGAEIKVALPHDAKLGEPIWSPDGKQFAFTNTTPGGIELWIGVSGTGLSRRIEGVRINGVMVGGGRPVEWLGDNRTLLVRLVPAGRGPVPAEITIPKGPHVQESLGNAGPAPTYEDLLSTPHDEDLFDYYATSQLAYLDSATGKTASFGKPAIYTTLRASPDRDHLLVTHLHRPYSYQLPSGAFPDRTEIWN